VWDCRNWVKRDPFAPPKDFDEEAIKSVDWDTFLGKAPKRKFDPIRYWSWRWYWDYAGGLMTDIGAHQLDIVQWLGGVDAPRSVVANGGNLLLMISPDGSGRVPANQVRRLEFMGRWLARYGEAVYATRAVGLARQPPWGYVTRSKDGHALYAVITRWPAEARIVLPVPARVEGAQVLGGPAVPARSIDGGIAVDLSRTTAIDPYASVVRVSILQGQDAPLP